MKEKQLFNNIISYLDIGFFRRLESHFLMYLKKGVTSFLDNLTFWCKDYFIIDLLNFRILFKFKFYVIVVLY